VVEMWLRLQVVSLCCDLNAAFVAPVNTLGSLRGGVKQQIVSYRLDTRFFSCTETMYNTRCDVEVV
jgi:hypothetical protein